MKISLINVSWAYAITIVVEIVMTGTVVIINGVVVVGT